MKPLLSSAISISAAAIALLSGGCQTPAVDPHKVLVTVNNTPIREQQVIEEADKRIDADAARSLSMGLVYDESFRPKSQAAIRDDVLHTLVERQLIIDQLKADHLEVTDAEVEAQFNEKARSLGQTAAQAEEDIRAKRKTIADVKEKLRWHTIGVEKLYETHATNKQVFGEEQARQVYAASPAEFMQEHERRVSRILINGSPDASKAVRADARRRAEELLQRIKAGEDFATLATTYSEDVTTRTRGGDRGWSPRGFVTGPGHDPFGDAAFAMKNVGDISDVVATLDGYEIVKLTGIREARQKSFDEVKDQIIARERYWEIGNFWEQYAAEMRQNAKIEWDPDEALRRSKKEVRERKYNEKIARQVARQEARAKEGNRDLQRGQGRNNMIAHAPPTATAGEPIANTAAAPPTSMP